MKPKHYLDFEQPLMTLYEKIQLLRQEHEEDSSLDLDEEINLMVNRLDKMTRKVFEQLTPTQIVALARHEDRPYTLDYIGYIFDDFIELKGDRAFADDPAIVAGLAKLKGRSVMVIGQQKGRTVEERNYRNFGMPKPEGYRKTARLMRLAERFGLPILTFIDTPGAYPGIDAEARGQSEAIASNLELMARLKVPIISTVIGEGGSGGALAIAVCDYLMLLEYSVYSVVSPEGCASILWRDAAQAKEAAKAMKITAKDLLSFGLIDEIIEEPIGGAHRNHETMAKALQMRLIAKLNDVEALGLEGIADRRCEKFDRFARFTES